MDNLTPIQQLTTTQRVANVQQMSQKITDNSINNVATSAQLSNGTQLKLISNLHKNEKLMEDMIDHSIVAKYLLIRFIGKCTKKNLTCAQLCIAIQELNRQIKLIEIQPNKTCKLEEELKYTKKLLHELEEANIDIVR